MQSIYHLFTIHAEVSIVWTTKYDKVPQEADTHICLAAVSV